MTLYAPNHLSGVMMALWYMINAFAGIITALLAGFVGLVDNQSMPIESKILSYQHGVMMIIVIALVVTLILFTLQKKLSKQ